MENEKQSIAMIIFVYFLLPQTPFYDDLVCIPLVSMPMII